MYYRYLKHLYEKASAAWRREQRKNPRPCDICGDYDSEVMSEGNWLCREHKAQWKALLPYKSYATRLTEMGIPFLSEADHKAGAKLTKKKKRRIKAPEAKEFQYVAGKAPAPVPRKKK